MRALAIVLLLAGCGPRTAAVRTAAAPFPPSDLGSLSDVRTAAGAIDGIDVVRPCAYGALGLVAHGARQPPSLRDADAYNRWATDLRARLAALGPPVIGVGWGAGCRERDAGPIVYVSHHREIDGVIPRLVRLLRDKDISVSLAVSVPQVVTPLARAR
jgi:hypothetical protein